ncbi:NUDIX hydrolase [Nocardia abscessus]|uniref:NUDIX hydrolase n=1 Tax=Nocardia abscessus TaxID=120957 RepID=UPI001E589EDC|nr:NUDIX domain-containing protein [Nocardia abscessus]
MSFRLAAYAVCIEDGRVLLVRYVPPRGETNWTLPGGGVEHAEDPFDAVTRELAEETGCHGVVERLLGVDSRVIPAAAAHAGAEHQNIGIFYRVRVTGGRLRHEPNGATAEPIWTRFPMSPGCAGHHWSTSVWRWLGPFRQPAMSLPSRSAA